MEISRQRRVGGTLSVPNLGSDFAWSSAAAIWARVDRELVDRAVWAPMINERGIDFVSARVGYQFHPNAGVIADQLWVR